MLEIGACPLYVRQGEILPINVGDSSKAWFSHLVGYTVLNLHQRPTIHSPDLMSFPEPQPSAGHRPYGIVVICTKDRPEEVEMSCTAANRASPGISILVIDASKTDDTRNACERLSIQHGLALRILYRRARQAGLARQRNEAVGICQELGADVIHFIDDDTEVADGYFDSIERRFREDSTVMGIGGIIVNQPHINYLLIKRIFLLGSQNRGSILRSGRNMMGQYPGTHANDYVEWLCGCSMSYRLLAFNTTLFDDRLSGYSLGEDYDFSFRLSRRHKLAVEPSAKCTHHYTATARGSMGAHARERTLVTHRWVGENRRFGMSPGAFWWSTFGDASLHAAHWLFKGETGSLQQALGVVGAVATIVRSSMKT